MVAPALMAMGGLAAGRALLDYYNTKESNKSNAANEKYLRRVNATKALYGKPHQVVPNAVEKNPWQAGLGGALGGASEGLGYYNALKGLNTGGTTDAAGNALRTGQDPYAAPDQSYNSSAESYITADQNAPENKWMQQPGVRPWQPGDTHGGVTSQADMNLWASPPADKKASMFRMNEQPREPYFQKPEQGSNPWFDTSSRHKSDYGDY